MQTEDDTFNALRRAPFQIVRDEINELCRRTIYSSADYRNILKKHNWKLTEFINECKEYNKN